VAEAQIWLQSRATRTNLTDLASELERLRAG